MLKEFFKVKRYQLLPKDPSLEREYKKMMTHNMRETRQVMGAISPHVQSELCSFGHVFMYFQKGAAQNVLSCAKHIVEG